MLEEPYPDNLVTVPACQEIKRMRAVEFVAELTILLIEGPQDKKKTVDLYYGEYQKTFAEWSSTPLQHRRFAGRSSVTVEA